MPEILEPIEAEAHLYSEPLYLSAPFLRDGHTVKKANGTITYVCFRDQVFGITCAHIYHQQYADDDPRWLTVHDADGNFHHFGAQDGSEYKSYFRPLRAVNSKDGPDIAIVALGQTFITSHLQRKGKRAFDLAGWTEPEWGYLISPVACGYPTEHKIEDAQMVSAQIIAVVADLAKTISTRDDSFLMTTTLDDDSDYFLSGMSGGAVYCVSTGPRKLEFIGIVYEGTPGSSSEWDSRSKDSFFTQKRRPYQSSSDHN